MEAWQLRVPANRQSDAEQQGSSSDVLASLLASERASLRMLVQLVHQDLQRLKNIVSSGGASSSTLALILGSGKVWASPPADCVPGCACCKGRPQTARPPTITKLSRLTSAFNWG